LVLGDAKALFVTENAKKMRSARERVHVVYLREIEAHSSKRASFAQHAHV